MNMNRRDFVKYSIGGLAAVVVGTAAFSRVVNEAFAVPVTQTLNVIITDAVKGMVTDNAINPAKCYFWIYHMTGVTADGVPWESTDVPGPIIIATAGDTIILNITNNLDEPHNFAIPGANPPIVSPSVAPGATVTFSFLVPQVGPYLYYDSLNEPVNRVMGLHGALIVMPDPALPVPGHRFTPYANPTPGVQALFDDFGSTPQWPGLAWEQGDTNPASFAPAFRQYVWLLHQASPNLFAEVGNTAPSTGVRIPANFINAFLRDPFSAVNAGRTPQYFTINGQSGHFSHNNPFICPNLRAGEPCVVHVMNAGLWTHSKHLHANHFFVTFKKSVSDPNGVPVNADGVAINPIWIDVFNIEPLDVVDYTVPYLRPPDIGTVRGIGLPETPLTSLNGRPVWPPEEEMALVIPDEAGIAVQLSPLCYPMHDHSEPSQTAQGGNYNLGTISGMNFTGDRLPTGVRTFANAPTVFGPNKTGPAAGPEE